VLSLFIERWNGSRMVWTKGREERKKIKLIKERKKVGEGLIYETNTFPMNLNSFFKIVRTNVNVKNAILYFIEYLSTIFHKLIGLSRNYKIKYVIVL
jgi:hypothetical protein